jgi:phage tail P2-like protein
MTADPALRPVFARLHTILQEPEEPNQPVADWSTSFLDEYLAFQTNRGQEFAVNYCDPGRCPDEHLDWLASIIAADCYWDSKWLPIQKRRFLVNIIWLRKTRGSAKAFRFLLGNFDLDATFEPLGGWIVSSNPAVASTLPATLSGNSFDWRISISANYLSSTPEYALILKLRADWLPCWTSVSLYRGGVEVAVV